MGEHAVDPRVLTLHLKSGVGQEFSWVIYLTNLCLIWKAFCCTNQEATVTLCATMTLASFHHHGKFSKQIRSGLRTSTPIKIGTKQEITTVYGCFQK